MGVDEFAIILDRTNAQFSPGENVTGHVVLKVSDGEVACNGVTLRFYGVISFTERSLSVPVTTPLHRVVSSKWSLPETETSFVEYPLGNRTVSMASLRTRKTSLWLLNFYFDETVFLIGAENDPDATVTIPEGERHYQFSFKIPEKSYPPSCDLSSCFIQYGLVGKIKMPAYQYDIRADVKFKILETVELDRSEASEISRAEAIKTFSCLWWGGSLELTGSTNRSGFYPGENVEVSVEVKNESDFKMKDVTVKLVQIWTYLSQLEQRFGLGFVELNSVSRGERVQAWENFVWDLQFPLPNDIPPTSGNSICMNYVLNIEAKVDSWFATDHRVNVPILIGAHLYTLKVLLMELTRTKHWGRVWSCVQSLMSPGILIGSGVTSYLGKPGFYACATCVLIGAGLIGFQLIDLTKCGSPQLSSSLDNDSPIPPAPPPISPTKYGTPTALAHGHGGGGAAVVGPNQMIVPPGASGMYPLRRSISLQQPLYPCCRGESSVGDYPPVPGGGQPPGGAPYTPVLGMHHGGGGGGMYSPYCRECLMTPPPYGPTPPPMFPQMIRSYSLPQTAPLSDSSMNLRQKTTGTQTNPNSPVHSPSPMGVTYRAMNIPYPGSFDRIHAAASAVVTSRGFVLPEDRVLRDPPSSLHTTPKAAARGAPVSALVSKPPTTSPSAIHHPGTDSLRRFQPGYKSSVMFASNPQLFPASSSATSTTEERSSSRGFDNSATPTPTPQQNQNGSHALQNGNGNHRYLVNNHHHHVHGSSSRDYYPQREERRATFLRHQQQHPQQFPQDRSFDSQKSAESSIFPAPHMQPQQQPAQHPHPHQHQQHPMTPQGRFSVAVEQHKRPTPHKKSQESIANGTGGPGSSPKPPLPKSQKPSSAHEKPAFTRHYFDSSKILPATKRKMIQQQHAKRDQTPTISAQVHQKERQRQPQQPHYYPRWTQPQVPVAVARQFDPFADDPDPPYYPAALSHAQTHAYHRGGTPVKISSAEFNIEPPKFNSLRRPGTAGSGSIGGGGDTTRGSSISSQLNLATSGVYGGVQLHQQPQHHHMLHQQPLPMPPHHHQPYLPPAPPIHPAYTPSRAQHYHPGAVPVYPPLAPQPHHGHHPPPPHHQTPSRHLPPHHHPQPQQHHPSTPKNVSSATNDPPPPNFTTNKVPPPSQQSQQQENEIETQQSRNPNQKSLLEVSSRTSQAKKSDKGFLVVKSDDDVEDVVDGDDNDNENGHDNYNNAATNNSRDDDDDHDFLECDNDIDANDADDDDDDEMVMTSSSSRDNFLGGPTIINLPPTILSGASPCPYCDVRRPQSSLSEIPGGASRTFPGSGSGGPGSTASGGCGAKRYFRHRFHRHMMNHVNHIGHLNRRLVPGYSLSLSVPALQHIYGSTTRHLYCSPGRGQAPSQCYGLYGNIAKSKDFANFHFAPIQFPPPKSTPKSAPHQCQGQGATSGGRQGPPPLLRRNTWHVPKDFLEQITTSV